VLLGLRVFLSPPYFLRGAQTIFNVISLGCIRVLACYSAEQGSIMSLNFLLNYGRAIAQAVSRRLPTASARVQTRVLLCGIL
jgi:hypothetical protein